MCLPRFAGWGLTMNGWHPSICQLDVVELPPAFSSLTRVGQSPHLFIRLEAHTVAGSGYCRWCLFLLVPSSGAWSVPILSREPSRAYRRVRLRTLSSSTTVRGPRLPACPIPKSASLYTRLPEAPIGVRCDSGLTAAGASPNFTSNLQTSRLMLTTRDALAASLDLHASHKYRESRNFRREGERK